MNEAQIRAGEERAFNLFQTRLTTAGGEWIRKEKALGYRGEGRAMIRSVYAVARHVEGARLSRALGKRGVDTVSLSAVRTALKKVGDGLLKISETKEQPSKTGGRLARFIKKTE